MEENLIDNSSTAELNRLVTWQYDNAPHLNGIIDLLEDFFEKAVSIPMGKILGLAGLEELDEDWALNVWGRLLGLPRPQLSHSGGLHDMGRENYRNLLIARVRLLGGNGSVSDYVEYVKKVFDGNASFKDNNDMTVQVDWESEESEEESIVELKALYDQYLDLVMNLLPTGVRLAGDLNFRIFSISSGETTSQDSRITNMNQTNGGCLFGA